MKEQQFLRQIHKIEGEAKRDAQRLSDKHESALSTRVREFDRTTEEIEDRLQRSLDEGDELRRKSERAERQAWEVRQQLEQNGKSEERLREQYDRAIESLRNELREKERDLSNLEMRESFAKQDLTRDVKEREDVVKKT